MSYVPTIGERCRRWVPGILMPSGVKIIEHPTALLLDRATIYKQCEIVATEIDSDLVESHPDDDLLDVMQRGAIARVEHSTGLCIAQRTLETQVQGMPSRYIEIPQPPLIEVVSVLVVDDESDGDVSDTLYRIDSYNTPARLYARQGFPSVPADGDGLRIRYRAGYRSEVDPDSDAEPLPDDIRMALLLIVAHWYKHREDVSDSELIPIPHGAAVLLKPHEVRLSMA
jgi:uncharacterized phiE125 gp8 family phage protein